MRVTLVPYVENELILRKIEHLMKGKRKLDRAEIGGEVPPAVLYVGYDILSDLLRESFELFYGMIFNVFCRHTRPRSSCIFL